jgi:aminoglycoside/choline kinase family phosphotransferase
VELLEDAGERSLADEVREAPPARRRELYAEVCAWIPRIQRLRDPGGVPAFARRLEDAHFAYKADLFCRHSLVAPSPADERCVRDAFAAIGRAAQAAPQRLAHRDLQSENVMVRDEGAKLRLSLIDLQGALCTAPEYDLVSLLRDSYVELPAGEIALHLERTVADLPDAPDAESAAQRFDLLTLTRKGKDHARFLFAANSRGDRRYLPFVAATVRHLRAAASGAARRDPAFAPLAELVHQLPEDACAR